MPALPPIAAPVRWRDRAYPQRTGTRCATPRSIETTNHPRTVATGSLPHPRDRHTRASGRRDDPGDPGDGRITHAIDCRVGFLNSPPTDTPIQTHRSSRRQKRPRRCRPLQSQRSSKRQRRRHRGAHTVAPTTEVPSPTAPSGLVPTVPPPLPTETFTPVPVVDTPLPTQPPAGGVIPPTPTAIPLPAPGLPTPVQTVTTISGSITSTIGVEVPPVEPVPAPSAPSESERAFDLALFIDNFVIALGYIWICCGILFLVAAVIGGVWFLRRPARSRTAPSNPAAPPYQPPAGPPPVTPQSWSAPAPSTPQPADPAQPAAPGPDKPRAAARHWQAPPDDFDHPSSS